MARIKWKKSAKIPKGINTKEEKLTAEREEKGGIYYQEKRLKECSKFKVLSQKNVIKNFSNKVF